MTDFHFTHSPSFGGGWLVPLNSGAAEFGEYLFDESPYDLPPLGGKMGWIVEPGDMVAISNLSSGGYTVDTNPSGASGDNPPDAAD